MADTAQSRTEATVISVDVMGGDGGVQVVIDGLEMSARKNAAIAFLLHGDETKIREALSKHSDLAARCEIRHSDKIIPMTEKPSHAARTGRGSSMWSAVEAVKNGEAKVVISSGNTGALMAVSMMVLRKAPGVHRPAIAAYWPSTNPAGFNIMLDMGADIRADANDLVNYAIMGSAYARHGLELQLPRVGLLNVGTEEHKGRDALHGAAETLEAHDGDGYRYIGFVEGSDIPSDRVDVIVTDGFTGNVALKTAEGTAALIRDLLKQAFSHSILSRMGALFALTSLSRLSKRIDPRRVNGGVFLGLNGTVIKSHGGSDATGFSAAIKLAFKLAESEFGERLALRVASSPISTEEYGNEKRASVTGKVK